MKHQPLPLHERWRSAYRASRYASHLGRPELNKRIRDIVLNMLRVTPDAKIGVFPVEDQTGVWWEKWTHVLEEMTLRYGPFPAGFDRDVLHTEPFPNFASELAAKAARKMTALGLRPGSVLIRLGKREHMEQLIERGGLRLQPASFYSRPELNGAIRDDEMSLPMSLTLTREQLLELVSNPQDVPADAPEQRIDIEFATGADFWLYCLSRSIEPRLFVDFNAEACVVIRNPTAFADRLRRGARQATGGAVARDGRANYVDPLLPKSPKIFIPFSKPFGYTYQDEYRFCWTPKTAVPKVEPLHIEIGSIADIAELVVLDS
jgi:hypothetical protein